MRTRYFPLARRADIESDPHARRDRHRPNAQKRAPGDTPTVTVEVLVVLEPQSARSGVEVRRAAARRGTGALRDLCVSVDDFLAQRQG